MVTRAVHLEVVKSMETDSFINALRRFVARRGPPSDIYSDNGTNFVGADRELKQSLQEWNQSQIADVLSQKGIQWHFNPPAAPHFGGIWERLVQSCKKALKVVLHGQVVTDEVLETAFAETEALVNSRPLTEVSSSSSDLEHDETQRGLSVSTSKECRAHGPPFLTYFYFNLSGNQGV